MKIQVKIEQETLLLLNRLMANLDLFSRTLPNNKTGQSIMIELRDILFKKIVSTFSKEAEKPIKITLRYHTTEHLYLWVKNIQESTQLGAYENNKLEILKNQIHPSIIQ
ncbi:hypothetical protein JSO53_04135 [Riemerella anatipestifer]|uniref:hypothetical protein n=1 Tax=Riemerella anatipestifer TaxID=34085 RepID=UPI0002AB01CA|nr:hypothetical protein [Riemerella anatipestifer]AGC39501.1 hypothetical protein G148_0196 [Riemerella anatipestifer RA-CH-2]AKP71660.1 hypothetical protein CG09_1503 [Riemerella anatipestifer]MBT0561972.1 hypothetical protein [Riemerella anatipestifer]MCU7539555.1 hypothetical protein [Riemerella anatipestifer]MCU7574278.1 hypothetical protein [Riemerella anatipestifer]